MFNKCQIFTSEEYTNQMLQLIGYSGEEILDRKILENSCGDGQILKVIIEQLINEAILHGKSHVEIKEILQNNIIGFEIDKVVYNQCITNLDEIVKKYNIPKVSWNIINQDYLHFNLNFKVDYIVGNPPYITYQELEEEERTYIRQNFVSCKSGKFDYCYPFVEKSITDLKELTGNMAYLIPTSIFKNVFGENLRNIMKKNLVQIYDFKRMNLFEQAAVSASIINIKKFTNQDYIEYYNVIDGIKNRINKKDLSSKWLFTNNTKTTSKYYLKDYFKISNSVATLLNSAFVINQYKIISEEYIEVNGNLIEREVLREAASPRALAYNKNELIIFPYYYENSVLKEYSEKEFSEKFPGVYTYLGYYKKKLLERKSDKKAKWFEYGRSQALSYLDQEKILLSSVMTDKVKLYKLNKEVIPYSGFYIIPIKNLDLEYIYEVMETKDFYNYLQNRGINANGNSLRFSVKDFLDYPIKL